MLASSLALTKAPWCDEGWFANPAYNLAFHGHMGSNVLEPSGHFLNAYLRGIQQRTYVVVPNHIVALAAWFRLFGFSLFSMRAYSIAWGAAGLACLFYLLHKLFPDPRVAQLGTLLTAIDFVYLWSSADGRMESSANTLALASLAAYLHFRERSFSKAIVVSQLFGATALFTHPNALVVLLAVPVLVWRFDRSEIQLRHLLFAAAPYLFFGILWSLYIAQSPADFAAQFFPNAAGRNFSRWESILQPWLGVWGELIRHLGTYFISGLWPAKMRDRTILIPLFYLAALIAFLRQRRAYPPSITIFLTCLLTILLGMIFLNGFKAPMYLIYLVPFYGGVLAFGFITLWKQGVPSKLLATSLALVFVYLQLDAAVQHINADEYHRDYRPTVALLEQQRAAGKSIMASAAFGFGLGFSGFADDWRLGLYSHLTPDILVLDRSYREFAKHFENEEPLVFSRFVSALTLHYRLAQCIGTYWIFERIPHPAAPWITVSTAGLKKKHGKAEYLFEQLYASKRN